jgi:NADH dehydrogenase
MLLVDFRSRLAVYLNWSWAWFTYGRGARLLTALPEAGDAGGIAERRSRAE